MHCTEEGTVAKHTTKKNFPRRLLLFFLLLQSMLSYKRAAMAQSALAVPCRCAKGKDVCSPQLPTTTATTDDQRVHSRQSEMMPYFKIAKMHLLTLSSLFILYTANLVACDGTTKYTCSQVDLNKLDSAFARVMSVSKYQRKIPEDIPQLLKYCK